MNTSTRPPIPYEFLPDVPAFNVTSTDVRDGETLSNAQVSGIMGAGGEDVSPQLSWSGVPDGTKSFALTMVDPEGRAGLGLFHWVAYGIPANVTSFAEGEVTNDGPKYVGGKSTQGVGHYSGPCTPPGSPHHYTFLVIATDLDTKDLPAGLTLP